MKYSILLVSVLFLANCAGMKKADDAVIAHAESFNLLFFQIPDGKTVERAQAQLPENTEIHTLVSTPDDLTSLTGVLNRLIGVSFTQVSGKVK